MQSCTIRPADFWDIGGCSGVGHFRLSWAGPRPAGRAWWRDVAQRGEWSQRVVPHHGWPVRRVFRRAGRVGGYCAAGFPETDAFLYVDQADLDPVLGKPGSPLDTFMLMYDECGRRTPLEPDEYFLVSLSTVEIRAESSDSSCIRIICSRMGR